ncbi:hypothetical protein KRP22_008593 [Phytophthora ramorum]|uniref:uncharacterized protein n=1 Tax=Phytophthora ramorum TaxID=164328 RepID=UPI00309CF30A|nr:hypothetical protein KRP23_2709 [Phytophthora ramorum]KAH7501951.1 hypothetical protein KRP22_7425 [Phytophthora ramorum]
MRLSCIVLIAVATLLASANAVSAVTEQTSSKVAPPMLSGVQSNVETKRMLRTEEAASEDINTEERRLVNVDLIIKDAVVSLKKAVKWKAEFLVWKLANKKPAQLATEWGVSNRGHTKWKKLMAYKKYYGPEYS